MNQQSELPASHAIDSRHGYAMLLMVVGSIAISFGGLVQRNIEVATPWQINVYRSLGMLLAIAFIIVIQNRGKVMTTLFSVGRFGILAGALLSVAGICFIQALTHTTVANALFVLGAIPFFTALLALLFLGERLRQSTMVTMLFAVCGLALMVFNGISIGSGFGNAMALLTAAGFAGYAVIVRYRRRIEMLPVLLISSIIIIVVSLLVTGDNLALPLNDILLSLFWGGCLSGFVNWTFIIASRHLAAAEVTLIMLLEFALGPVWVWLFVDEVPSRWTLIGGAVIIAAVAVRAILELINQSRPEQTPSQPV
ncbi:MAG: EamA family transporter [Gammaproteobacteria bacterium]|jgi:drug/metabolite transporter (DMT)-like permease|nr:EamA family transporter [Gammaproteobacteria bacterium]